MAEAYDEDFGQVGLVYAREVPGHLVFRCALAIDHEKQSFEATFAALSGREVLRVSQDLPEFLRIGHLVRMVTAAAIAQGVLRSQNQEVRVLLAGHADQLDVQTVLWNKRRPFGLLQRRGSHCAAVFGNLEAQESPQQTNASSMKQAAQFLGT